MTRKLLGFSACSTHLPAWCRRLGNYVIQKFFEYGSAEQRQALALKLVGHVMPLVMQV